MQREIRARTGLETSAVRVHHDSPLPSQLRALATTAGLDIHLGPGHEEHLGHEAWHVVQQAASVVRGTRSIDGLPINGSAGLERDADRNGSTLPRTGAVARHRAGPAQRSTGLVYQLLEGEDRTAFLAEMTLRLKDHPDRKHLLTLAEAQADLSDTLEQARAEMEVSIRRSDDEIELEHRLAPIRQGVGGVREFLLDALKAIGATPESIEKKFLADFATEVGTYPIGMPEEVHRALDTVLGRESFEETLPDRVLLPVLRKPDDVKAVRTLELRLLQMISGLLGLDRGRLVGGDIAQPLPNIIHFVWSGREIAPSALANIVTWAARAETTEWNVLLWTDHEISKWPPSIVEQLKKAKVQLLDVNQIVDKRLRDAYLIGRQYNLAGASDLVRLSALHVMGGIYSDVDIAPGSIDLPGIAKNFRVSPLALPLFGPGLRDIASVRQVLKMQDMQQVTDADVREAIRIQTGLGNINNNFIVAHPRCMFLDPVINFIRQGVDALGPDGWAASSGFIAGVTGPMAIKPTLERMVAIRDGMSLENADKFISQDIVCRWLLGWLTADSEDQDWNPDRGKEVTPRK